MTNKNLNRLNARISLIAVFLLLLILILSKQSVYSQLFNDHNHLQSPVEMRRAPGMDAKSITNFNNWEQTQQALDGRTLQFFPDSILVYSVQNNPRKYNYLFSNNGELLTTLVRIRQGALWINESIENRTYDALGNMSTQQWQAWTGNDWVNSSRSLYTYDDNRKILTHTEQTWNSAAGNWTNFRRTTNTWTASGFHLTMLQEIFSDNSWTNQVFELYVWQNSNLVQAERQHWTNGNWTNAYQYQYSYNPEGNLVSMTMKQWAGNQWSDFYREVFSYNTSNQLIIYVSQIFSNNWQNSEQYFYSHDPLGFLESAQRQVWQSGTWQNSLRRTFTNNNFGSSQLAVHEIWQQNGWVNQHMFTKGFDESGNTTISNAFVWSDGWQQNQDNQIEIDYDYGLKTLRFQGYKAEAGYISMLVSTEENKDFSRLQVYPNPSDGKFFIFNELLASGPVYLHIFAIDGKEVFSSKYAFGSTIFVDIGNKKLNSGTYLLRLISSKNTFHHHITLK